MPEIYQNSQKVDDKGVEGQNFFQIFKRIFLLVFINVHVRILESTLKQRKDSGEMAIKTIVSKVLQMLQLVQTTNSLKRSVKHNFWFLFILLFDFMYICK